MRIEDLNKYKGARCCIVGLIDRIDTICLTVSDLEASSIWYRDKLRFSESFNGGDYRILKAGENGIPLTLEQADRKGNDKQAYPIFFSQHIDELYNVLKREGVELSSKQFDGQNTFFDFYDPDGNKLQVCYWE
ncbi:VOC family protein [Oceanobacillus massiliensis]|uniref:VOC family protein n=1 Tax=Oceanobacillus massiliensis TaxID=1465765 RepID=UPI0002886053|nr:VOC family protein [Oceanobacillus massiliensis]